MTENPTPNPAMSARPNGGRWRSVAIVVLVILLVLAVAGLIREHGKVSDQQAADTARATALSTARQYALDFSTYDYTTLDATFKTVAGELTGSFKTQYLATSTSLKTTLEKYQGKATASIQAAGVTSATPSKAVVVVLLDQSVTSVTSPTPRVDRSRMVITLMKVKGHWLMSNLDLK